jgi:hypothetical protein
VRILKSKERQHVTERNGKHLVHKSIKSEIFLVNLIESEAGGFTGEVSSRLPL